MLRNLSLLFVLMGLALPIYSAAQQPDKPILEGMIAFTITTDTGYEIAVLDLATGKTSVITKTPEGDSYLPRWSPDGSKIVYLRDSVEADDSVLRTLHVVNWDGSGDIRLSNNTIPNVIASPLQWSSDSQMILFATYEENGVLVNSHYYTVNADGSGLTQIPFDYVTDYMSYAAWTPDNKVITLFDTGIYRMNRDGSNYRKIIHADDLWLSPFALNPEGKILAAELQDYEGVVLFDLERGNRTMIIPLPQESYITELSWSPTGEGLAVLLDDGATYVLNLKIKAADWQLISYGYNIADWSPDGEYLVYEDYTGEEYHLFARHASGQGDPIELTDFESTQADWK